MASGGNRPTAPQNNPSNISATGGRGQNPKNTELKYRGMGYGTTGEINASAQAVPGAVAGTAGAALTNNPGRALPPAGIQAPVTPLNAPTQFPEEPITSGSRLPGGVAFEDLNLPQAPVGDPDLDQVRTYFPVMQFWASQPDTPQATKDYVRFLGTII